MIEGFYFQIKSNYWRFFSSNEMVVNDSMYPYAGRVSFGTQYWLNICSVITYPIIYLYCNLYFLYAVMSVNKDLYLSDRCSSFTLDINYPLVWWVSWTLRFGYVKLLIKRMNFDQFLAINGPCQGFARAWEDIGPLLQVQLPPLWKKFQPKDPGGGETNFSQNKYIFTQMKRHEAQLHSSETPFQCRF